MRRFFASLAAAALAVTIFAIADPVNATTHEFTVRPSSPVFDANNTVGVLNDHAPGFGPDGSIASNGTAKTDMYFPPGDLFGRAVELGEVESISFWTKKGSTHAVDPDDWYLNIYTKPYVGDASSAAWYGDRIGTEPYFAATIADPADAWNEWSTGGTANTLRFYESTAGAPGATFGAYTDPHWDDFLAASALSGAARADQEILFFSMQTASNAFPGFEGQLDGLTITLTDSSMATVNFEPDVPCTTVCYVDAVNGDDAQGGDTQATAKQTIQAAINQVDAGGQVRVLPGSYDESAPGSAPTVLGGTYQFGLFFPSSKPGITLMGVDVTDVPIDDAGSVEATITTNATNNFGRSGIFVEAAETTIRGVEIGPNTPGDNKTIEVVADGFTLRYARIAIPGGGSVYLNDFSAAGDVVKSYHILDSDFPYGTSIDISSGAGSSEPLGAANRQILRNTFDLDGNNWNAISFNGSGTGVPWFTNTVGGAVIQDNEFSGGSRQYIRARGDYPNAEFDWESFWNDNVYGGGAAVALVTESPFDVRTFSYTDGYTFNNVRRIGATVQGEVGNTVAGDTVLVKPGTYPEHVTIGHPLTLKGANAGTAGTAVRGPESKITGDASGAVQITGDDVVVDGFKIKSPSNALGTGVHISATTSGVTVKNNLITGNQMGIYANSDGTSVIKRNLFDANNEAGAAGGSGIYSEFSSGLIVENNEFRGHTTNSPIIFAATGAGVHSDLLVKGNDIHDNVSGIYVVGVSGGTFRENDIRGAAGGTALGFGGASTDVTVTQNTLRNNARGVRIRDDGYGLGGMTDITVRRNAITGNTDYGIGNITGYTGPLDATCNWYGAADGPSGDGPGTGDAVDGDVSFVPWLTTSNLNGPCPLYEFLGFFQPVDNDDVNIAKAGQNIAVKWRLLDENGDPVSDPSSFVKLGSIEVDCDGLQEVGIDRIEDYTNQSGLLYQGDGYWQFNWDTVKAWAGTCRLMTVTLYDGTTKSAEFRFK